MSLVWTGSADPGQGHHLDSFQRGSPLIQLHQEGAPVLGQREEQQQPLAAQQQLHSVSPPGHNMMVKKQIKNNTTTNNNNIQLFSPLKLTRGYFQSLSTSAGV